MNNALSTGLLALITATCLLACKPAPAEPDVVADEPAAAAAPQEAPPAASTETAEGDSPAAPTEAPEGGSPVMAQPLDGSSVEAFEKGVQMVHEEATPDEATRLDNAIQYLLVYDLAAKRDKAKLYARLNGKTPTEVISQTRR